MIIKAIVKLQRCRTSKRQAFVGRDRDQHGIAKGPVQFFEVTGDSWTHVRRVLKNFDVMGYSEVRPTTVERFTKDLGNPYGRLRLMHPQDLLRELPDTDLSWLPEGGAGIDRRLTK